MNDLYVMQNEQFNQIQLTVGMESLTVQVPWEYDVKHSNTAIIDNERADIVILLREYPSKLKENK